MARIERGAQRDFVDEAAARAIDDAHALLRLGEVLRRQDVLGLRGQRRVQRDEIGAGEQGLQFDLLDAEFLGALFAQERIEGDDAHLEADAARGDDRADVAAPMTPSVLPVISTPMKRFFSHLPA